MKTKYILITGGELYNKGAQSMTFITVDEMKNRFPNHEVLVVSKMDFKRSNEEKSKYDFKILDDIFSYHFAYGLYGKYKGIDKKLIKKSKEILENTEYLIDISGYALGSDWSFAATLYYTSKIKTANKYGAKVYLMPQSFGPFDYKGIIGRYINSRIKNSLDLCTKIYAREKDGLRLLTERYNLKNVELSTDLVLQNKKIDLKNIFSGKPIIRDLEIKKNSVAIVPNMKNFKHGNKEEVVKTYVKAVKKLLELDKNVYLVRHSFEDIKACELIKSEFEDYDSVILLGDDYSCIEYDNMVKKFEFLIASRYHSIIHAYREGVPCIALGWAIKYHELLGRFNQSDYIFDVRKNINYDDFLDKITKINNNRSIDSTKISEELKKVRNMNVFKINFE